MLRLIYLLLLIFVCEVCSSVLLNSYCGTVVVDPIGPYPGSDNFTWSPGVPSINLKVSISNYRLYYYFTFYLHPTNDYLGYIRPLRYLYTKNPSLANISVISGISYNINLGSSNSLQNYSLRIYCSRESLYTPIFVIKGCSSDNQWDVKNKTYNFQEEVVVSNFGCTNSIVMKNRTNAVFGRKTEIKVVCGSDAQWIVPHVNCWNGSLLDFNKKQSIQTFMVGTKTLIYCDTEKQESKYVHISGDNLFDFIAKKISWAYVSFKRTNHKQVVTCIEKLENSTETTIHVQLDIQFPPLLDNGTNYERFVTIGEEASVKIEFQSNPHISVSKGAVTATKNGSSVTNLYTEYDEVTNKLTFHFQKVFNKDIGDYIIIIHSGWPFYTTHDVIMTLKVNTTEATTASGPIKETTYKYASIGLAAAVGILLVVVIVAFIKISHSFCFKEKVEKGKKCNPDPPAVGFHTNTYDVRFPAAVPMAQYNQPNIHNYEIPLPSFSTQNGSGNDIYEDV